MGPRMNPPPVAELQQRTPESRPQNVKLGIAENAVDAFDYYLGYTFVNGKQASQLELWGFPWWTADRPTGFGAGAFGAGPFGQPATLGNFGALRFGMGAFGTGA